MHSLFQLFYDGVRIGFQHSIQTFTNKIKMNIVFVHFISIFRLHCEMICYKY